MRDDATARQVQAARPNASTWLTANAGSGKTKVLTDRVARLLWQDTPPQNILCLTFTKAAASEMQNRLFRRLGEWAMAPEAELLDKLDALGLESRPSADRLSKARTLFARAVETPGGLKIQTIHSFCAAILRRFPLEAGVPPNFTEMDDRKGRTLRDLVLTQLAEDDPGAVRGLAPYLGGEGVEGLLDAIIGARTAFAPALDRGAICAALLLDPALTEAQVAQAVLGQARPAFLDPLAKALDASGVKDQKLAAAIRGIPKSVGPGTLELYAKALLTGKGLVPKRLVTKAVGEAVPDLVDDLQDLVEAVFDAQDQLKLLRTADRTAALHQFAGAFLDRYARAKAARGWLDFDDLILRTRDLLQTPGLADWVLFRLDGGIDHILVDEAQDTSPIQWQVIALLAGEISAGSGRADAGERTLFVVGDRKQSIYSFQGADPHEFDRMQIEFSEALAATTGLQALEMEHSFRSAPPILSAVDTALSGLPGLGGNVSHIAFHERMPGRVDLWPLAQPGDGGDDVPWFDPTDRVLPSSAPVILARSLAQEIRRLIDANTPIQDQKGKARRMTEGDILILFRSRGALFDEVIAACKAKGLAIAGADRMKLAAELAVRDLCALLSFLATPEDDLSLAAALRSPLLGWSEDELYRLAQPRGGYLWQALRGRTDMPETLAILDDLRGQADFLRPFELIERVLVRHQGRARLLARLGDEAEDGIDVLLGQALDYETAETPSLTGFLEWLSADDISVKRQAEQSGGKIRVMTVHGAKGLESPLVILPDTLRTARGIRDALVQDTAGHVFWKPAAADLPEALRPALDAVAAKDAAEEQRLLYVAMTRAESWLIVAGAHSKDRVPDGSWYAEVAGAMDTLAAGPLDTTLGEGKRVEGGIWPGPVTEAAAPSVPRPDLPGWLAHPLPREQAAEKTLSPSDLGGAKALPGEGQATEAALAEGAALHLLLEHLPGCSSKDAMALADTLLPHIEAPVRAHLLAQAQGVLAAPELAPLFGPDSLAEVPVAGRMADLGGRSVYGIVDRLIITPDEVLIVDYKTNHILPKDPAGTPEGLLRQMGAYAAVVSQIYPSRRVVPAILWTRVPRLDLLPVSQVSKALARAQVP